MKKILVLDLDGTLTNHKKEITPKTKAAIMEMQKQGHTVVLASGRPTRGVDPIRKELELDRYDGYTLAFNGARITRCSTNEVIYQQTLPEEIVPELFAMAKQEGIGMMTYDEQGIIANRHEDEFMDIEAMINQVQIRQSRSINVWEQLRLISHRQLKRSFMIDSLTGSMSAVRKHFLLN